jgi:CMP/dCMP kinase
LEEPFMQAKVPSGMSKTSITISRQLGSQGCEIARALEIRLGYRLAWRDMINEAGRRAGTPEIALDCIDELGLFGIKIPPQKRIIYKQAMEEVICELASQGNVIVLGRAGQAILRGFPSVLHVRVIAPKMLRAERIAEKHGLPVTGALAQVEASDRTRRLYVTRFYNVRWDDPELYDLVINTGNISPQTAALLIEEALSGSSFARKTRTASFQESSI